MTLLSSGNLSLLTTAGTNRNISQEVDRNSTAPKNFNTIVSNGLGTSLPVSFSDFYSFTQPYIDMGTITYDSNTPTLVDVHRPVNVINRDSSQWTVVLYGYLYCLGSDFLGQLSYSKDGGSNWTVFLSLSSTGSATINQNVGLAYSDTLQIRMYLDLGTSYLQGQITLSSVNETSGSRVPYIGTTNSWVDSLS
jgi:hypothetical protein